MNCFFLDVIVADFVPDCKESGFPPFTNANDWRGVFGGMFPRKRHLLIPSNQHQRLHFVNAPFISQLTLAFRNQTSVPKDASVREEVVKF